MDNKEARRPGHESGEATMRAAYDHVYQLRKRAISADTANEYAALNTEASQLERIWLTGPSRWALQWRYLDAAVENWANDPESALQLLDQVIYGSESEQSGINRIERDSLLQAERLTLRPDGVMSPTHTSTLAYIAAYTHPESATADVGAHTSWWKAREWVRDHAIDDADKPIDFTIAAHDLVSGKRRVLTTATAVQAADVITELDRMTTVLGGAREPDGKEFVDDLHYDILCDDYQTAMTAANHPAAGALRIEHKLCADDLRDQTLDFAHSIGKQDAVGTLADIDRTARAEASASPTPKTSWLDQVTNHAERAREQMSWNGIDAHYTLAGAPSRIIHAGRSPVEHLDPWYGEELRLARPGGKHTGEMHQIGRYASCQELIAALENHATTTTPAHHGEPRAVVPADVVARLGEFDQRLRDLDTNLRTSTTVRAAIRSGQPVQLTRSATRSDIHGSAPGRDPAPDTIATAPSTGARRDADTHRSAIQNDVGARAPAEPAPDASRQRRERMMRQPSRFRSGRRHL